MNQEAVYELIALYAAGALPQAEQQEVEERLRQGWPEGEAAWQEMQPALQSLLQTQPPEEPSPALKARLLEMLPQAKPVQAIIPPASIPSLAGITFQHQRDAAFMPTPYPGISIRMLHVDQKQKQFSALMKVEPGAVYPHHHHDGYEECLVLEGTLMVGDTKMVAGDYQRADAGSDHVDQWSETGALLYINAPLSLLG